MHNVEAGEALAPAEDAGRLAVWRHGGLAQATSQAAHGYLTDLICTDHPYCVMYARSRIRGRCLGVP